MHHLKTILSQSCRRQLSSIRRYLTSLFAVAIFCIPTAHASDFSTTSQAEATAAPAWTSAAHFGFGIADQSSTGFKNVGGSLMFLDVGRVLTRDIEVGLRTVAEGGRQSDGQFYRMGSGPLVSWHVAPHWVIQASYGFFNETALNASGGKAYRSRGQEMLLGWERSIPLTAKVEFAWGGFLGHYQGNIDHMAAISPTMSAPTHDRFANVHSNQGNTHGLELGLRMTL